MGVFPPNQKPSSGNRKSKIPGPAAVVFKNLASVCINLILQSTKLNRMFGVKNNLTTKVTKVYTKLTKGSFRPYFEHFVQPFEYFVVKKTSL